MEPVQGDSRSPSPPGGRLPGLTVGVLLFAGTPGPAETTRQKGAGRWDQQRPPRDLGVQGPPGDTGAETQGSPQTTLAVVALPGLWRHHWAWGALGGWASGSVRPTYHGLSAVDRRPRALGNDFVDALLVDGCVALCKETGVGALKRAGTWQGGHSPRTREGAGRAQSPAPGTYVGTGSPAC